MLDGWRWWEAPEVQGIGRLPARSPLVPFPDAAAARGARQGSPWFRSLDGPWRFRLVPRPEAAPRGWQQPGHDDGRWATIPVPGCWTMHGYDRPHYTNVVMPWPLEPPHVPRADNPTGLYRRAFRRPPGWARRRIVLSFGGAESALGVWVNGVPVGMHKDSRLGVELDVTEHVRSGTNLVAAMVVRWSDGTWVEDQDHWWHGGLHREVVLLCPGRTWISDVRLTARLGDDLRTGTLDAEITVATDASPSGALGPGWVVDVTVETPAGRRIGGVRAPVPAYRRATTLEELVSGMTWEGPVARASASFAGVAPWSSATITAPSRARR
jgi:beta-galactosidase